MTNIIYAFAGTLGLCCLLTRTGQAEPLSLSKVYSARCSTAFCFGDRESWYKSFGFEVFADLPIGGAWLGQEKDRHPVSGLRAGDQLQKQFNRDIGVSFQGGARFFWLKGLISLGFGFSAYKTPAHTLERDTGESLTIGSGSLTASPVLCLGIIEDVVGLSWTTSASPTTDLREGLTTASTFARTKRLRRVTWSLSASLPSPFFVRYSA